MSLETQDVHNNSPTEIRPQKKETQNQSHKFSNFWNKTKHTNLDTKAPNKKKTENDPIFETPFPRISGVQIMPRQKINERGKKSVLTEIILYKRKGGIMAS